MIVDKPRKKKKFSRYSVFKILMGIIFAIIIVRLIYLQIYKHDDYNEQANTITTKFVSDNAPRGKIYDNDGNILADSVQIYNIIYTTTPIADRYFYETVDSLSKIFSENGEIFKDELMLKLNENNEFYFDYKNTDESLRKAEEIRFKRDRGMNTPIEKKLNIINKSDLSEDDINKVNEELLKISPKDTFKYLVKLYDLIELIYPMPLNDVDSDLYDKKKEEFIDHRKNNEEEILNELLETYSYNELRQYMVVKDALKIQSIKGFKSVTLADNIKRDTAFIIYQKLNDLPGIDVRLSPKRVYPYDNLASSVIGYLSKIDESKKNNYELKGYDVSSDLIGVSGIESAFEEHLKGVKGGTTVKVNSKGRVTEELFKLESYPGNNIYLTIDKDIQAATESALVDAMNNLREAKGYHHANRGAAVVVEVKTGRILALVSYPNYNPNEFSVPGTLSNQEIQEYFSPDLEKFGTEYIRSSGLNKTLDELFPIDSETGVRKDDYDIYPRPFYNYATLGLVPPGSTFKPMTGIAALESGVVNENDLVNCTHTFNVHPDLYGDSFAPTCLGHHGNIPIRIALEQSCNFYFYEMAYRLYVESGKNIDALDALAEYAWHFGLGVDPSGKEKPSTGLEIEENFGQVYNFESYKKRATSGFKFTLAEEIESGYTGGQTFIPLDYSYKDSDSEKLKEAKDNLKDKITDAFNKVGTNEQINEGDKFAKEIEGDVRDIMSLSDIYKENIEEAKSNGRKVDINTEAKKVSKGIEQFVIFDKSGEIKSPAQEVFSAIGQGMNAFTPVQLAQYVSTIANNGVRYKLHLVDKIENTDGEVVKSFYPEVLGKIDLKDSTIRAVKEGMEKVNMDENGTAISAWRNFPILTAGKTGTADSSDKQEEYGRAPYATYISYAPKDDPEIAFVGVVYDGGHGGNIAYVAKTAYEVYFKDRLLEMNPNYSRVSDTFSRFVMTTPEDNKDK